MSKNKGLFLLGCMLVCITGCVAGADKSVSPVKKTAEEAKQSGNKADVINVNAELDFKRAVQTAVRNMLQSGALDNPSGDRYIVAVSNIKDFTKKDFNTKDIKQRLERELASGRKVRVISSSSKTVMPQITISGKITQRTASVRGGKKRTEYYLHLVSTEVKTGTQLGDEIRTPVVKKAAQKKYSQ